MSAVRDLAIAPSTSGAVEFKAYGICRDENMALLQRLYVSLFTGFDDSFREYNGNTPLTAYLCGANQPPVDVFNGMLPILLSDALKRMDKDDRKKLKSVTAEADDYYNILCTVTFADGTAVKGIIQHG